MKAEALFNPYIAISVIDNWETFLEPRLNLWAEILHGTVVGISKSIGLCTNVWLSDKLKKNPKAGQYRYFKMNYRSPFENLY